MVTSESEPPPRGGPDASTSNSPPDEAVLLAASPEPCFVLDHVGRFTYINPAAEKFIHRFSGNRTERILGHIIWDDYRELGDSTLFRQCKQALHEQKSVEAETFYFPLKRCYSVRVCPTQNRLCLFFRDITEPTDLKRELRRSAEKVAEAQREHNALLNQLGHEVRNVLSVSRNAFHLLGGRDMGPVLARACTIARREVRRLGSLLDDLFMVTQLSTLSPRKQRINLAESVGQALAGALTAGDLAGRNLTLQLSDEPLWLDADPMLLEQVCRRLLDYSVHSTGPGGDIRLTTEQVSHQVVLRIRDDGLGLAPEVVPHLFDCLADPEGAGPLGWTRQLGLGLVRQLVAMHGGTVEAKSEGTNRGSEIVVRLPAALTALTEHTLTEAHGPCRILVVDDSMETAHSLAQLLHGWGCQVGVLHDGPTAVDTVPSFLPDLVLLETSLPGLDGFEVARRLRRDHPDGRLTIVALTGNSQASERDRALKAGFDFYMVKPVEPADLRALVEEVQLAQMEPASSDSSAAPEEECWRKDKGSKPSPSPVVLRLPTP
jgi:signal transduction histidine kinase/DNA-binding NarL/FixJ family response regulator